MVMEPRPFDGEESKSYLTSTGQMGKEPILSLALIHMKRVVVWMSREEAQDLRL